MFWEEGRFRTGQFFVINVLIFVRRDGQKLI